MNMLEMYQRAIDEIKTLRRENEILGAKVDTMNLMGNMLLAKHPPCGNRGGMHPDILWELENELNNATTNGAKANPLKRGATGKEAAEWQSEHEQAPSFNDPGYKP